MENQFGVNEAFGDVDDWAAGEAFVASKVGLFIGGVPVTSRFVAHGGWAALLKGGEKEKAEDSDGLAKRRKPLKFARSRMTFVISKGQGT